MNSTFKIIISFTNQFDFGNEEPKCSSRTDQYKEEKKQNKEANY